MPLNRLAVVVLGTLFFPAYSAWADGRTDRTDGRRDLQDGIAFYENMDADRAFERLNAAVAAPDLKSSDRARAYLYIGMLCFEGSNHAQAEDAWTQAMRLDPKIEAPAGTSPKTLEAIEVVRRLSLSLPRLPSPIQNMPENSDLTRVSASTEPEPSPKNRWLMGGIGAVTLGTAAIVAGVLFLSSGHSECQGAGGCITVRFR